MTKKIIIGLTTGVTVFGATFAMAAGLGGLTSGKIGAANATVAACDTDGVTSSYTSGWDATDGRYEISTVTVGGVNDACDGQTLSVTLTGTGGASVGSGSITIPTAAATSVAVSASVPPAAADVTGVHVSIAG